jgi:hypothetical protein
MPVYLPDQITIAHGPTELLARCLLIGFETARREGAYLRWHGDMARLLAVNERHRDTWYELPPMFDPRVNDFADGGAGWIEAAAPCGASLAAIGLRRYRCERDFAAEFATLRTHYADPARQAPSGEEWRITAPSARRMQGTVFWPGTLWVRPDRRGSGLAALLSHLAIVVGWTRWAPDYAASVIKSAAVARGVAGQFGLRHMEPAVTCRNSRRWGDMDMHLVWLPRHEFRQTVAAYFADQAAGLAGETSRTTETSVATGSPEGVRQGRISLS